jgi:hypothetical protein
MSGCLGMRSIQCCLTLLFIVYSDLVRRRFTTALAMEYQSSLPRHSLLRSPTWYPSPFSRGSGPTSIRAMCAGALETLASTGIGTVLENACKQYQRDLATAIP